ncbi:MAG: signal peptidase I [Bowdeniella nasicola]|nr:signal peptidase I [Bowdeniella nasicola]
MSDHNADGDPPTIPISRTARRQRKRAAKARTKASFGGWLKETAVMVAVALLLSFLVKTFLIQAFHIPSGSMEHTLDVGDRILVNKTVSPSSLARGDVIVFTDPGGWLPPQPEEPQMRALAQDVLIALGIMPADAGEHLVKRIIGLPGDHVKCCTAEGLLEVNGAPLAEPYLDPATQPSLSEFDVEVPAGHLWMMGDNRGNSRDSRAHIGAPGGGFVPLENVAGRAFFIMWPSSRWGSVN